MTFAECARSIAAMTFGFLALLGATAGASAQSAPDYAALLAAPERSDADRQADKRRDPLPLLAFAGVRPGMKVLDMGAGGGYSTEMLARAVVPGGVVYGQNPPDLFEKPKATFEARLKTPAMKDVVADIRPFDDPVPPDAHDFDLITFLFFYHDTTYMNVDRAEMNRKLFAVESALRQEIEAAGFRLVAEGDFWRNPDDTHDFPSYRPIMPVDNFVLKFQKPM
jgi:predicted methyltransferase